MLRKLRVRHYIGRQTFDVSRDGAAGRKPDPLAMRGDMLQRAAQMAQPKGLPGDIGMQRHAAYQGAAADCSSISSN